MRLKNRKRYLTQWDKGHVLIVDECPPGTQVHFSNTKSQTAYVIETNENGEARIPDIILQEPYPITAWIYREEDGNYYTENRREFQVIKRPMPDDYIWSDEESRIWDSKVDKDWGTQNAGRLLSIGNDGMVTVSEISDMTISDRYFQFVQNIISDEWFIEHNLNKYPSVTVVDSAGTIIHGEVTYLTLNSLKIKFQTSFLGKAYLN